MGKGSSIQWTHHTFNPVWGCAKVSPGCTHCYAEAFAKRTGHKAWGVGGERRTFGEKHWNEPLKWNAAAAKTGERHRVFCASMADVFEDHPVWETERPKLLNLIDATPNLDWLLLTKRPENIKRMLFSPHALDHGLVRPNIWLGTTVEDQRRAEERIPHLIAAPAAVRFLSCEPLLEPLNLSRWFRFERFGDGRGMGGGLSVGPAIDWIIIGGESGGGARPFDIAWARSLVEQARAAGAAPFVKQLGARAFVGPSATLSERGPWKTKDRAGGDMAEWPESLRVREFPRSTNPQSMKGSAP